MNHIVKSTALLFIIITLLQSCGSLNSTGSSTKTSFWKLVAIEGQDAAQLFGSEIPTIKFNYQTNTITGNAGCNKYFGKFASQDNQIRFSDLGGSMMICNTYNQEQAYLNALSANTLTLQYNQYGNLILINQNKIVLEFQKATEPISQIWE